MGKDRLSGDDVMVYNDDVAVLGGV